MTQPKDVAGASVGGGETLSDLMDTHGKAGTGCPKCAKLERELAEALASVQINHDMWQLAYDRAEQQDSRASSAERALAQERHHRAEDEAQYALDLQRERGEMVGRCAKICNDIAARSERQRDATTNQVVANTLNGAYSCASECSAAISALSAVRESAEQEPNHQGADSASCVFK